MSKLLARKPRAKRPAKEYTPSEAQICIALVDYVAKKHPDLSEDFIKIDNENKCSWAEGKSKKAQGKRKGASDYFLALPRFICGRQFADIEYPIYYGLWLEVKKKGGKESLEQRRFGQRQIRKGYQYKCVYSVNEGIAAIEEYLGP